jgi:hypothetical protein
MASWLQQRAEARRVIHAAFGVAATYEDDTLAAPVVISVRWHSKRELVGNINGGDYAEILSTIQNLLFNSEEMATKGITLKQGGLVKLTEFNDYQFMLDVQEPPDGPIKIVWSVVRP